MIVELDEAKRAVNQAAKLFVGDVTHHEKVKRAEEALDLVYKLDKPTREVVRLAASLALVLAYTGSPMPSAS